MRQATTNKKAGFFSRLLLFINLIFAAAILMAYLGFYISPEVSFVPALFGLAYPILFLANLFFIIIWIFRKKWLFLFSLVAILAGYNFIGDYFQLSGKGLPGDSFDKTLKVFSFNVHSLTATNQQFDANTNRIYEYIASENPDVICLQEYTSTGDNYYYPLQTLKNKLNADNYYFESYYNPYAKKIIGMVIFSKYKSAGKGILRHDSTRNFGIYNDLVKDSDTFRVYNIHLESVYLNPSDYEMVKGNIKGEEIRQKSFRVLSKLRKAFKRRALQVELLDEELNKCPYPVIICGDFNDTPVSYAYKKVSEGLEDAFVQSGSGIGKTFSGRIPFLRIDYILYDPVFTSYGYETERFELSDHFPVSCYLSLEK